MRIVGNREWPEFAATPQEALERGARLDAMIRLPGVPDFQLAACFAARKAFSTPWTPKRNVAVRFGSRNMQSDLLEVCRRLQDQGVRYVLVSVWSNWKMSAPRCSTLTAY